MVLYDKKQYYTRREMRRTLEKATPNIPKSGHQFARGERIKMESEIFGKELGEYITRDDFHHALGHLKGARAKASGSGERLELERKIHYLEQLEKDKS